MFEPGTFLRREGGALKVCKGRSVVETVPAEGLRRLILVGWISLSGPVLDFLIKKRIETVFLTPTGRFRARLTLDEHRHVALRKAQYLKLDRDDIALAAAKAVVKGKLMNLKLFMQLRGTQYKSAALRKAAARIKGVASAVDDVTNLGQLRGVEGLGTRIYFEGFPHLIQNKDFVFAGRNRRPPKDPVNALLSFVYTLLTNEVLSAVKTCGLDPYLGALHEIAHGRPSLACDLVEEYRPFLGDRLVLNLINRRAIRADDFVFRADAPETYADEAEMKAKRPVEMKPGVARTFIAAYEVMMNQSVFDPRRNLNVTHRSLILNQARRFAEFLQDEAPAYAPFLWL